MRTVFALLLFCVVTWHAPHACAQEAAAWPRFRGHNGEGVGLAKGLAGQWTDANYQWTAELGGRGHGSPVVWGERVFVTAGDPDTGGSSLVALDAATGNELWRATQPGGEQALHAANSYASTTPALDAQRVYLSGATPDNVYLAAYSHTGDELWRKQVGPYQSSHGFASSPVVTGNVVLLLDDQQAESAVMGFDASTGEPLWRTPRPSGKAAYGTPCVMPTEEGPVFVVGSVAAGFAAYEVADGKEVWRLPDAFPARCVSTPILAGDLLMGACGGGGSGKLLLAVRVDGRSTPATAFELTRDVPYVPTPLVVGDLMILWHDRGTVAACDATTGEPLWRKRIGGNFFGSPVSIGDAVVALSVDGDAVVLRATRDGCELLATNPLGEASNATPAVAHGRLYVRTESKLHCLAGVATAEQPRRASAGAVK